MILYFEITKGKLYRTKPGFSTIEIQLPTDTYWINRITLRYVKKKKTWFIQFKISRIQSTWGFSTLMTDTIQHVIHTTEEQHKAIIVHFLYTGLDGDTLNKEDPDFGTITYKLI